MIAAALAAVFTPTAARAEPETRERLAKVQAAVVKIFGAGGFRGLEAYQTGLLISPDGHVLTVMSPVLDTPALKVVLDDGRRLDGKLLGADARLDVAVLRVEAQGLPYIDPLSAVPAEAGTRVFALSNLFGVAIGNEPVSVQQGVISIVTELAARQGAFDIPFSGRVYVLDAVTSNPGSAGGVLVTRDGRLLAILGKELRNRHNNTWLNYAIPIAELRASVDAILAGGVAAAPAEPPAKAKDPLSAGLVGLVLIPDILPRTPPYIDAVVAGSPGARAGLRPDDLVVSLDGSLVSSCKALAEALEHRDRFATIRLGVLRDRSLVEVELSVPREERR